jgi:hypothetical protein
VIPILVRAAALNAVGNITLLGERRLRARAVHEQPVSICRTDGADESGFMESAVRSGEAAAAQG